MENFINKITYDDALKTMKLLDDNSVSLIVTSPPYWNLIDYGVKGQYGQCSYEEYLYQML